MRRFVPLFFGLSLIVLEGISQQKWSLQQCVEHAMKAHLSISRAEIQAKLSQINVKQNKWGLLPNLNISSSGAFNSGLNQDPTTFTRVTESYLSAGMQLQSSADIFQFFAKRLQYQGTRMDYLAAEADVQKIRYDIGLSAANAFLQALLAKQQVNIARLQIEQTLAQLSNTHKLVDAGTLPPINLAQLEAQWALDSSNFITAQGNASLSLLTLKTWMNIDAGEPFDIEEPAVESIPVEPLADLQPEYVYDLALKNQPQQKSNDYRLLAAQLRNKSAKASRLPALAAFGSLGSNYLSFTQRPIYNRIITGYQSTGLVADAGNGLFYDVQSPVFKNGDVVGYFKPNRLGTQLTDNFRKTVGLSLSVPIFNGGSARFNVERSKLDLESANLQIKQDNLKLKQDIYQAHQAASIALQKFQATKKSVSVSEQTFEFATKRFNVGMLSTFDLISSQNNLLRARLDFATAQFDYVFKMKVLEYYKGLGLKLTK
jgi:outer membrane protein